MGIDAEGVKAWLRRYGDLDAELDFSYTRLDELDETMISVKSPTLSDMPHGARVIDKTERYIVRKERIQDEIQNLTDELIGLEAEIEETLKKLPKSDERNVLRLRYLDLKKWNDISFSLFGSKADFADREESYLRRTTKLHSRALDNLAEIMKKDCPADILQDDPQDCL